ncbi:hypothetical protein MKK88_21220 [Methylobacterium sp. E-005]|uniref:hypothetical protein n=1 Tax=Methylobacterium sp. E-005 TaxID=2836549 RepID=UPI001FBA9C06|nr:hypothetical protein [Methylobacterium sp. E-005]MCJ2088482.1 hypothetical protein [Methylobacterium sp. E-005]
MRPEDFGNSAEAICYGIAGILADRAIDMRAATAARMTDELAARIILQRRAQKATIARQRADGERRRRMIIAAGGR